MKTKLTVKVISIAISVLILLSAAVFVGTKLSAAREPEVTNDLIAAKLESVSELTTAQLTYNGLLHYEEGKIPLLTQKAFFMLYCAEVEAGIDLSQVKITVSNDTVELLLPQAEVLDVYILPDSIQFYDEKSALLNWDNKNDALDAIAAAEADVLERGGIDALLETADQQTILLLKALLSDTIGARTLVVGYQ